MRKIIILITTLIFTIPGFLFAQAPEVSELEQLNFDLGNGQIDTVSFERKVKKIKENNKKAEETESTTISSMSTMSLSLTSTNVIYVAIDAFLGDGTSWASPVTLQTALSNASSGDMIWIKQGTYKPTTGTSRTVYFNIPSDVSIYGGFNGTETQLDQRDWRNNLTVLSGDIGGSGETDNSDHVVYATSKSNIVLDGLVIEKGYSSTQNYGGGFYGSSLTNLTIRNCTFRYNKSDYHGGGIYLSSSSANIINCTFYNNQAISYDGGGIFATGGTVATIGSLFYSNSCGRAGGGLEYFSGSNFDVTNCTFSKNSTNTYAAGLSAYSSTIDVTNCIVYENIPNTKNFVKLGGGVIHAYYTLAQEASSYFNTATSLINTNPLFTDATNNDFTITSGSPCVNTGTPNTSGLNLPSEDLAGTNRIMDSRVDMGAYELGSVVYTVLYAIGNGNWTNTSIWSDQEGGSSINAYPTSANANKVVIKNYQIEINSNQNCKYLEIPVNTSTTSLTIKAGKLTVSGDAKVSGGALRVIDTGTIEIVNP